MRRGAHVPRVSCCTVFVAVVALAVVDGAAFLGCHRQVAPVNGTPTGKPSAQTLPPEIEIRDRARKCGLFRTSRASRGAPTPAKLPETVRKTCPRSRLVEIGRTAWRWTQAGVLRAHQPRYAGFGETGHDVGRPKAGSGWTCPAQRTCRCWPRSLAQAPAHAGCLIGCAAKRGFSDGLTAKRPG